MSHSVYPGCIYPFHCYVADGLYHFLRFYYAQDLHLVTSGFLLSLDAIPNGNYLIDVLRRIFLYVVSTASMKKVTSSFDSFLWPNKYMLNFLGFWPPEPGTSNIFQYFTAFRAAFSVLAISFLFVPEIMMIVVFWGDIAVLTGVGCVSTTLAQLIFKMLYVLIHHRRFCRVYRKTREFWSMTDHEYELRQGLEKIAAQAKKYSIAFFFACFCNNISFTTTSVITWFDYSANENKSLLERSLPFEVWLGIDLQQSPNFELIFVLQSISAIFCCFGIVGLDTTLMTLILHVCGQFKVVGERLRVIGQMMHDASQTRKSAQHLHFSPKLSIGQCVRHHQQMINFAEEIRNLLSPIIFVQLLTSGLEICLSGYAVIVNSEEGNYGDLIKCTGYFLSVFLQLIIWCWPGQILIQNSSEIGKIVLYELPWWQLTVEEQRQIVFVIIRSQKECRITALGFQTMSMSKLTEVFNTAGSYLALLRRVYEKQTDDK